MRAQRLEPATMSEHDGVRYLHLGTPWVQGAMRVRKPQRIELEYVQRMMAWMLWKPQDELGRGHAVQLGLGAAAITRFTHSALRMRTTAVELNPTVIAACRLWFHLPADDARLAVLDGDAARWVADPANLQSADALSVDLYDHDAAAPVLDGDDFYAAWQEKSGPRSLSDRPLVRLRKQLDPARDAAASPDILLAFEDQLPAAAAQDLQAWARDTFGGDRWDEDPATVAGLTDTLETAMLQRRLTLADRVTTVPLEHLTHRPFVSIFRIENQVDQPVEVTVRVFLVPKAQAAERRVLHARSPLP